MLGYGVFLALPLFFLVIVEGSPAGAALQKQVAKPKTVSSEVRAACDVAYAVAVKTPGVSIGRRTGIFHDQTLPGPVFGCGLAISGSFARAKGSDAAAERLRAGFSAGAWQEMLAYGSDGKDGTSFAFRKAGVACLVRGEWNGGSDEEPEIPAEDWYKVAVVCTSPPFAENRQK